MNTTHANRLGATLTRLTQQGVYVERVCRGNTSAQVFFGTLQGYRRSGHRQMTLTLVLTDVTFINTSGSSSTTPTLEVEVNMNSLNTPETERDSASWTTKTEHFRSYEERCDVQIGAAAERFRPAASIPTPAAAPIAATS